MDAGGVLTLAALEDKAFEAVGCAPAQSLADLRSKFAVMLEGMGERVKPCGLFGSAGTDALNILIQGVEADAARLLV